LNEGQYRELCDACDRVLLSPRPTIERVAIPWLHVIREHPVFLEEYSEIFQPFDVKKAVASRLQRILRRMVDSGRSVVRRRPPERGFWFGLDGPDREVDVLFVSHFLNASQAGQGDDFYFGNVPALLANNEHSVLIALINHSGHTGRSLADKWNDGVVPRLLLCRSLRPQKESAHYAKQKRESLRLRDLAQQQNPGILKRVLERASEKALSNSTRAALRVVAQVDEIVRSVKPKAIVVTYEGHAWERVAFASAREARPGIVCVGYQHSAPFRLQHAIGRSLSPAFNPDHILTAGTVGRSQLESSPNLGGIPVSVMGSTRYASAKKSAQGGVQRRTKDGAAHNQSCLVIPEGIESECVALFEFSLMCAEARPEIEFVWRLHPVLSYQSLVKRNRRLKSRPSNVVLSQDTLDLDIKRCRWTLYRGSTAVIQAVVSGLRPIYLHRPGEMKIDPLYDLKDWKVIVEKVEEFERVVRDEAGQDSEIVELNRRKAELYCSEIFQPLDANALVDVIRKLPIR